MASVRGRRLVSLVLVGLCAVIPGPVLAQFDEMGVKSAFIFNFISFVEWPASRLTPDMPLSVCVLGNHPIAAKMQAISGQVVKGHPVRIRPAVSDGELGPCHLVFVPAHADQRVADLVRRYPRSGILFVGEDGADTASVAVINLAVVDKRVTFDVNLDAARTQDLVLSSKLLRLARRVRGAPTASLVRPVTGGAAWQ